MEDALSNDKPMKLKQSQLEEFLGRTGIRIATMEEMTRALDMNMVEVTEGWEWITKDGRLFLFNSKTRETKKPTKFSRGSFRPATDYR